VIVGRINKVVLKKKKEKESLSTSGNGAHVLNYSRGSGGRPRNQLAPPVDQMTEDLVSTSHVL